MRGLHIVTEQMEIMEFNEAETNSNVLALKIKLEENR